MWIFFSVLAGLCYTVSGLTTRHVLKGDQDAWAFSFYFSAIGALIAGPLFFLSPQVPSSVMPWVLIVLIGFLVVAHNWLSFKGANYLDASLNTTLSKLRLIWVLLAGAIVLHESLSINKIIGTLLTVFASLVIAQQLRKLPAWNGVILVIGATFFYTIIVMVSKILLNVFSPVSLTFFIFFIPAVINFGLMPKAWHRIKELIAVHKWGVILACVAGGFANLAMNQAYQLGEASRVVVLMEAFSVVTLMVEALYLNQRQQLLAKIVSVVLAVVGAILIAV